MVVLKEPDYAAWVSNQAEATGMLAEAREEVCRLIQIFNEKPIVERCLGMDCTKCATRATVYQGAMRPHWWCEKCNPYSLGAFDGKLMIIGSYEHAICYVSMFCRGCKYASKSLIRGLAQGKGLPERVGENQAAAFFSTKISR